MTAELQNMRISNQTTTTTNMPIFNRIDGLPPAQPTLLKHWNGSYLSDKLHRKLLAHSWHVQIITILQLWYNLFCNCFSTLCSYSVENPDYYTLDGM